MCVWMSTMGGGMVDIKWRGGRSAMLQGKRRKEMRRKADEHGL